MPLRKLRARRSSTQSDAYSLSRIPTSEPSDKAQEAGMLAQQLGSERSWADRFVPELPGSPVTPSTTNTSIMTPSSSLATSSDFPSESSLERRASQQTAQDEHADLLTPATTRSTSISRQVTGHELPPAYDDVMNITPGSSTEPPNQGAIDAAATADTKALPRTPTDPLRSYTLSETYKSISGTFTFYDYLELSTSAGSINVTLDPQPSTNNDKPAILRVNAHYGSVKISVSDKYLDRVEKSKTLPRAWDVEIIARTGSITTKLPLGRGSCYLIDAHIGSLKSVFYAASVGVNDDISTLTTQTGVGSQKVTIESHQGKIPVSRIHATHHAKSHGSLKVEYPKTWTGRVHASSGGYGSVKVSGDKLEHTRYGDKEQVSWRGEGELVEVRCDGHGGAKIDLN